jgi:hypothetical protein
MSTKEQECPVAYSTCRKFRIVQEQNGEISCPYSCILMKLSELHHEGEQWKVQYAQIYVSDGKSGTTIYESM